MNSSRRICAVAAGMAMVMAFLPGRVSAADFVDFDSIAFTGTMNASTLWVGGSGAFTWASNTCVWASDEIGTDLNEGEADACSLVSAGVFTSDVCGTATFIGQPGSFTEGPDTGGNTPSDVYFFNNGYTIETVDGIGVFSATNITEQKADEGPVPAVAFGVVVLEPTNAQVPPGLCTNGFTMTGSITLNA